jgi:hypothetical protein
MGDFFKMTEDEIVAEAMKAVIPEYLEWIRSTGRFDVERCVDLELDYIGQMYRKSRSRHILDRLTNKDTAELDQVMAHFQPLLFAQTQLLKERYLQGRKVSEINAVSAKAILTEFFREKGLQIDVIGQRYRSRVDVKLNPMTTVRFYVPYKKMNQEGLLDETLAALLEMKNALEKLGKGASIRRY